MSGPAYLRNLVVGQSVRHWKFGVGQVVATDLSKGYESARIQFGVRGVHAFRVDIARLVDPADQAGTSAPWQDLLDDSKSLEPLGQESWVAWLGPAVVDDDATLRKALADIDGNLRQYPVGKMCGSYPDWPDVNVLLYPAAARRVDMVLAGVLILLATPAQRRAIGMPFYNDWNHTHVITPRCIRVCEDRVEALVEADLHLGAEIFPIAFGLPTFDLGRELLAPDRRVTTALTALAFECEPAPTVPFRVRHAPGLLDAARIAAVRDDIPDDRRLDGEVAMRDQVAQACRTGAMSFGQRISSICGQALYRFTHDLQVEQHGVVGGLVGAQRREVATRDEAPDLLGAGDQIVQI